MTDSYGFSDFYKIDTSDSVTNLENLGQAARDAKEEHENFASVLKEELTQSVLTAEASMELLKEGFHEFVDLVKDSTKEYLTSATNMMRLDVALKNAGNTSEEFREHLEKTAVQLEALTGQDRNATIQLNTMLTTMGVAPEQLDRFTRAAISLGTAMGTDATLAAKTLARANEEGKDALKRFGITVEDVDRSSGDFSDVLDAVEKRFGNLESAIPKATQQANELSSAWKSAKESLGGYIVESDFYKQESGGLTALLEMGKDLIDEWGNLKKIREAESAGLDVFTEKVEKVDAKVKHLTLAVYDPEKDAAEQAAAQAKADAKYAAMGKKAHDEAKSASATFYRDMLEQFTEYKKDEEKEELENYNAMHSAANLEGSQKIADAKLLAQTLLDTQRIDAAAKERIYQASLQQERDLAADEISLAKNVRDQLLAIAADQVKQLILGDTQYTRALQAQTDMQIRIGKSKSDADAAVAANDAKTNAEQVAALEQKTASVLADIATQAGIKALFYAAEGIGYLVEYNYSQAATAFEGAAAFGAAALAAGGVAYGLSSSRGMTAQESGQLQSNADAFQAKQDAAARAASQGAQRGSATADGSVAVNIYHLGVTGMNDAAQGAELARIQNAYNKTKTGSGSGVPSGL